MPARVRRYVAILAAGGILTVVIALWTAPRWLVPRLSDLFPGCLYRVVTSVKAIALTIDDGPDPSTTPEILRVLREHEARATFFLISSNVVHNDSVVVAMIDEGHEIANHLTRDEPSVRLSARGFDSALTTAERTLSRFDSVRWARPGGGWYSQRMVATMRQRGYQCALGSVYPYDAEIPSTRFSSAFVLANLRPGAIVVLHEGGTRGRRTAATLRRVLPELRRRGYDIVTLSELTRLGSL